MLLWGAIIPKTTLPMRYKPNTSPAVLELFLFQMKGPEELLQNILHKIPSLSPALPHTESRTQHVKGEAVQEHRSCYHRLPEFQKTSGISAALPCQLSRFPCTFLINTSLFILMSMLTGISGNASNTSCSSGIRLSVPSH